MGIFSDMDAHFARLIDDLAFVNPFRPERLALEQKALGDAFSPQPDGWRFGPGHRNHNLEPLIQRVATTLGRYQKKFSKANPAEQTLIRSLVRFHLYYRHEASLFDLAKAAERGRLSSSRVRNFPEFASEYRKLMAHFPAQEQAGEVAHLFALCFQARRAFEQIFLGMIGASEPAALLRAQVWESIFTCDMRRYERALFDRMHQMNTLIVGPSGTGKELVARAIGESRYVRFDDESGCFSEETHAGFLALNLSALAPTLTESELFGHKKGSFTGAISDHPGLFESCMPQGTMFLDEIGELSLELQVKLLRTLQVRETRRVGEHKSRKFLGKLVSATNRDLAQAVRAGTFREDFCYRLRADQITTPTLKAQLDDCPEDLDRLVDALVARFVPESEVQSVKVEVLAYLGEHLVDYPWPGNVRELEQAILSLIVHGRYVPPGELTGDRALLLGTRLLDGHYSLDDLSDLYVTLAHERYRSYAETARRLQLDRRTVKAKVRPELLDA